MTVAAVGVVGAGWWMVNSFANPSPLTQVVPAPDASSAAAPPAPAAAPAPAAGEGQEQFAARAEYVADIALQVRVLVVELTIDGASATAYVCDGGDGY